MAPLLTTYPYNIILSVVISLVAGWIVRFTYDKIRQQREEARTAPLKEVLMRRISAHCNLLWVWIQALCDPGARIELIKVRIEESTNALVESVGNLGKDIISSNIKKEVLELERLMRIIINDFSIGKYYPEDQWLRNIKDAAQQLSMVFGLIGDDVSKTLVEVWFEV